MFYNTQSCVDGPTVHHLSKYIFCIILLSLVKYDRMIRIHNIYMYSVPKNVYTLQTVIMHKNRDKLMVFCNDVL
jgi:hypothetical protein